MPENQIPCVPVRKDNPSLAKDPQICIYCGQCRDRCIEATGIAARFIENGPAEPFLCVGCGQCIGICPTGALRSKSSTEAIKEAIADPDKIVIFSTSPSVRVALGEDFGMPAGSFVEGQMVDALRKLGGDYVLDVTFGADMTICEESVELVKRIVGGGTLPQFTSCCPSWVRHAENCYPKILPHLSTTKSPIGIQGATIKTYFAGKNGINPRQIVNVAVTPCTAKKAEILRPELNDAVAYMDGALQDNDYVLTTHELATWMKDVGMDFDSLDPDAQYDDMMGKGSGAGVIFGNTGGVMEAALRAAYSIMTGEEPSEDFLDLEPVRGQQQIKGAVVKIKDRTLRVGVVFGLNAADTLLESGAYQKFDFIEVMCCPGGCIGGGGQPVDPARPDDPERRDARIAALYSDDARGEKRSALDNPDVQNVYSEFYEKPGSPLAEKLLHTTYSPKKEGL